MIGKIIGALVGREIDRRDGKGGAKGAVAGYISAALLRRAAAIGLLLGAAYYTNGPRH